MVHETDLKTFVALHQEVLDLTQKFMKLFRPMMLFHYMLIFFFICMTAFEVVIFEETGQKIVAFSCSIVAFTSLLLYSYSGQVVMESSVAISSELYEINKDFLFVIMRTQKPVKLNFRIFDPNLFTCKNFIDYLFSLIACLKYLKKM